MDDLIWDEGTVAWVVHKKARTEEDFTSASNGPQLVSVKFSDIPSYLHNSEFYKGLSDGDDPEDVLIPERYYCVNDEVRNFAELLRMLEVMSYWSVMTFPDGVIRFCQNCDRAALFKILNNVVDEVDFLTELKHIFCSVDEDSLIRAITFGRTEIVEYLAASQFQHHKPEYVAQAAYLGKLNYIKILHDNDYVCDFCACVDAAMQGHLDCLMYLHENGCDWNHQVYIKAASNNHEHCFYYAAEQGLPWHEDVSSRLARWNEAELLRYAIEHGCPCSSFAVREAAADGNTECLRIILNAGCPLPENACLTTTNGGHFECLRLLHEHGAPCGINVVNAAASSGYLPCLEYLHERGCPWDESISTGAARNGQLSTLRYAMQHGCPYADNIITLVAGSSRNDTTACLKYLIEEEGLFMGDDGTAFITAIHNSRPESVQYLIDQGYSINQCSTAAQNIFRPNYLEESALGSISKYSSQNDEPLLQCLEIALGHGWDIIENGLELLKNVMRNRASLPQSHAFLKAEGYLQSCLVGDDDYDFDDYDEFDEYDEYDDVMKTLTHGLN